MVRHRPPEELLMDYAAGSLEEPLALLVATHLSLCPQSRDEVKRYEAVGGVMLEDLAPEAMSDDALERALAAIERPDETSALSAAYCEPAKRPFNVPSPLGTYLNSDFQNLKWRRRSRNIWDYELLPEYPGFSTKLLRIRGGAGTPHHTHDGREVTLVLQGSFSDETGHYGAGDVAVADGEIDHHPIADVGPDCICLAVTDAPLRLTGPVGRVLNLFVKM